MVLGYRIRIVALFFWGIVPWLGAYAVEQNSVDALLSECAQYLASTPENTQVPLEKLQALQATFTPAQNERYHLFLSSFLGFRGKHDERIGLVQRFLDQVKAPAQRAKFLYQLIDSHTALGQYESALQSMNEAILLLPKLDGVQEKITVLQGALALSSSLHAYDDALSFAERIYALRGDTVGSLAACVGLTDKVEMYFMRGDSQKARSFVQDAVTACDENKNRFFTLIIKTDAAIDLIDAGDYSKGIATSLPLLRQFSDIGENSDYVTQLEDALARAFLNTGNLERAERYGLRAYQRAQSGRALLLQEKTSETMATIKRAQGQFAAAIGYYDTNLTLKRKVLDDQLQKNLAYQRVKFDAQDKANQVALLEQKNKNLSIETELHQGRYQNLILLLTLGLVALAILGAWLAKTLKQKNIFRISAQMDGLTQVSNRAYFTACAKQVLEGKNSKMSLLLFDMDLFKKINDTYGHATGDWVLKTVCEVIKTHLRKVDIVGRLGGEEFAICLPASTADEALALAERCRAAIAAIDTHPCGFSFPISASFGIATRDETRPYSYEETLVAADKALYLSKNDGRNRVTVYQHPGVL